MHKSTSTTINWHRVVLNRISRKMKSFWARKEAKHYVKGYVELGTIQYVNLTTDGRHGDFQAAIDTAAQRKKPIFANFVEWSGWQGYVQWLYIHCLSVFPFTCFSHFFLCIFQNIVIDAKTLAKSLQIPLSKGQPKNFLCHALSTHGIGTILGWISPCVDGEQAWLTADGGTSGSLILRAN